MQQNPSYGENLGNWYLYFSHSMSTFFPSDSHPMVYFIIWEIHVFSHQFPIAWEKPEIICHADDTNILHKLLLTDR